MHYSRMCTARLLTVSRWGSRVCVCIQRALRPEGSSSSGSLYPGRGCWADPKPVNRETDVKTLLCPKRRLRPVIITIPLGSSHNFEEFYCIMFVVNILTLRTTNSQNPYCKTSYKARHAHKRLYTVLPKYSKIQVLPGITSCRLMKYNKQAIELNSLLNK